ncbi:hypothetical protein D3C76_1363570 [compost metagenome]
MQTIQIALLNKTADLFIVRNLFLYKLLLFVCKLGKIKLISEITGHCHISTKGQRGDPSYLMIRHSGHMRAYGTNRIHQTCSVLNLKPFYSISIVTGPGLRHVMQHAWVETATTTTAALEQNMWKL